MQPPPSKLAATVAFMLFALSICLFASVVDPTPLVVDPKPDLDLPLGIVGVLAGLWSAHQITRMPYVADKRLGRWALWIMLPIWLGFGLTSLAARLQELNSFRDGATTEEVTALVVEKERSSGRRTYYHASVASAAAQRAVRVEVDLATFEHVKPNATCVSLLLQRAADGAVRLLKPLRWNVPCS